MTGTLLAGSGDHVTDDHVTNPDDAEEDGAGGSGVDQRMNGLQINGDAPDTFRQQPRAPPPRSRARADGSHVTPRAPTTPRTPSTPRTGPSRVR